MRIKPFHEMQVGMAKPGDGSADQNLARTGFLQTDVLDHQWLVDFMQDGGLHRCFLFCYVVRMREVHSLSHGERVGVRGYGLSLDHNPSPGSQVRSDLSRWER